VEAAARARSEIAQRGLVAAVVKLYYGLLAAERKYATAQQAAAEAERFFNISQKLERGGEVAHSDVVKANLQFQQQKRDLQEAQLGMETARLDLAILLFPDFNQNFTVVDNLQAAQAVPTFEEAQSMAAKENPELRAALASFQAAKHEVGVAWGGVLPTLTVDYFYGIDASHFAVSRCRA
jgi:outer membrane protein TolC